MMFKSLSAPMGFHLCIQEVLGTVVPMMHARIIHYRNFKAESAVFRHILVPVLPHHSVVELQLGMQGGTATWQLIN